MPTYTNSSLASCRRISPNRTSPRNHSIDRISVHCLVGQWTARAITDYFANASVQASPNYGVGLDGSIGLCVEEKDRSWCTSSRENDNRAITIETASDTYYPYRVKDAAFNALLDLCTDICKRNGKSKLLWFADKNKTLSYQPASNEMVMTVHRWFAQKECPGQYLYDLHSVIANEVTRRLAGGTPKTINPSTGNLQGMDKKPGETSGADNMYRVRKSWSDSKSQLGAYTSLDNAKKAVDENPGYKVFDSKGKIVYEGKTQSSTPSTSVKPYSIKVEASDVPIRTGPASSYSKVSYIEKGIYTIVEESGHWGKLKSGVGWVNLKKVKKL